MAKKAFETYRVQLQMRSQAVNTVHLNRVTAPEFLLLQHVHGKEAAKMLERQGDDIERRINEEGKPLQRIRPVESLVQYLIDKYNKAVFEAVFPGANPVLPYTYEDAGLIQDGSKDATDYGDGWEEIAVVVETKKNEDKPMTAVKPSKDVDLIGTPVKKA